jgi:hypothetical protein
MSALTPEQRFLAERDGGGMEPSDDDLTFEDADGDELRMPASESELHGFILERWGYDIPAVAICRERGHVSPMTALWEIFSETVTAGLWLAPRGGSKSFLEAILMMLDSIFRPGVDAVAVAATEAQAGRISDHLRQLLRHESGTEPEEHPAIARAIDSKIVWRNGCQLEILPSTMKATNGPHTARCYADEIDLMAVDVFEQSRHISQESHGYVAVDLLASTMKFAFGQMAKIIGDCREAEGSGDEPPYQVRTWCWREVAKNVPNCRCANPDLPEEEKCNCNKVVKGKRDDGSPRTFESECNGALARSAGYMSLHDLQRRFRTTGRDSWDAEMSCLRPSSEGLILRDFRAEQHTVTNWTPQGGMIFQGIDWGGDEPHAIIWIERLRDEFTFTRNGIEVVMPVGSYVVFDSIYVANIGLDALADRLHEREDKWRAAVPDFRVALRFADETGSGRVCRQTWAERRSRPIITQRVGKDLLGSVKVMTELVGDDMFYVDRVRCPMLIQEIEQWHRKPGSDKPDDVFDHAVSATRYALWGAVRQKRSADKMYGGKTASGEHRRSTGYGESPWASSLDGDGSAAPHPFMGGSLTWDDIRRAREDQ